MNLRKFRRATVKKQILDDMSNLSSKNRPSDSKLDVKDDAKILVPVLELKENFRKRKLSETKCKD